MRPLFTPVSLESSTIRFCAEALRTDPRASGGVLITSHPLASRFLITFVLSHIPDALNTFDVPYGDCTLSHMVVSENVRKLSKATST